MLNPNRIDEDRIPNKIERVVVRARAKDKKVTFKAAWLKYMQEEQKALDSLLAKERRDIKADEARGKALYEIEAVLRTLHGMQETLGYTAMRAINAFDAGIAA